MSHQTGLKCSSDLLKLISSCKSPDSPIRVFKVFINREQELLDLAPGTNQQRICGKWEDDFARYVPELIQDRQHCYLFFRMTSSVNASNDQWAFIYYAPETVTNVRQKMLYASSKGTLKNHFGTSHIDCDYFADSDDMLSLGSFQQWLADKKRVTKPEEFARATDEPVEQRSFSSAGITRPPGGMISSKFVFPIHDDAAKALRNFQIGKLVYVKLNIVNEEIELAAQASASEHPTLGRTLDITNSDQMKLNLLQRSAIDDNLGFHIIAFDHLNREHKRQTKILFGLVIPSDTPVRKRMIYSTWTGTLVSKLTNQHGIVVDKRFEVDNADEVTVEYAAEQLYPENMEQVFDPNAIESKKFEKPLPPGRQRGPKRLIK
ncbi:hypothetical protein RDWZM_003815 [Blomia tropicalis]|uniref:ADF-H domain-containing protein n=1 Tax=Blomia tropicalis TaxID=40697 RepID=A0A9Q0MFZ3_BLOTA|nr:hypothetical protein RDWZM_003815 [Blomia tropicalis]